LPIPSLGAPGVYYAIGTGAKEAEGQVDEIADAVRADRSTDELRLFPPALRRLPGILPVTRCATPPSAITSGHPNRLLRRQVLPLLLGGARG